MTVPRTPLPRLRRLAPALLLAAGAAHADIAPPAGWVETCTPERQCPGQQVDLCPAYFGDREVCARKHAGDGFTRVCRTRGSSAWTELWCRPKAEPRPGAAPAGPKAP